MAFGWMSEIYCLQILLVNGYPVAAFGRADAFDFALFFKFFLEDCNQKPLGFSSKTGSMIP
jgi:hypothetical protein